MVFIVSYFILKIGKGEKNFLDLGNFFVEWKYYKIEIKFLVLFFKVEKYIYLFLEIVYI